jgi:carboxypeptidase Taq
MLADDLALGDLPGAWNDGMRDLLGLVPPNDTLGCLQDIHWPAGIWGYFPTYTLGALAAAQFAEAADASLRQSEGCSIDELVAEGRFAPIVQWLRSNIHSVGASDSTGGIIQRATGRPLNATAFKVHLQRRYHAPARTTA